MCIPSVLNARGFDLPLDSDKDVEFADACRAFTPVYHELLERCLGSCSDKLSLGATARTKAPFTQRVSVAQELYVRAVIVL